MHTGLIVGLVIGVITLCLLVTITFHVFYSRYAASHENRYELPPPVQQPIQGTKRHSWHQPPPQLPPPRHASVLSAMASPAMSSPVTATATTFNFSRLSVPSYTPVHQFVEEPLMPAEAVTR